LARITPSHEPGVEHSSYGYAQYEQISNVVSDPRQQRVILAKLPGVDPSDPFFTAFY
jgi:hypothetical protein